MTDEEDLQRFMIQYNAALSAEWEEDEQPEPARELPDVEPIRNESQRVGRNEPCPCGSGRKYKKCCLRIGAVE
jgi:preprotein translocase subunit SecA